MEREEGEGEKEGRRRITSHIYYLLINNDIDNNKHGNNIIIIMTNINLFQIAEVFVGRKEGGKELARDKDKLNQKQIPNRNCDGRRT